MLYGTLFALTNRIQTIGDGVFFDITVKQHFVLMTVRLFDSNHPTLKDIADIIGCSYQNIKKIAVILEKKGYLRIERDLVDKRKYRLILTDKVNTVSSDIDEDMDTFLRAMYKDIPKDQLINTLSVLMKVDRNIKEFWEKV